VDADLSKRIEAPAIHWPGCHFSIILAAIVIFAWAAPTLRAAERASDARTTASPRPECVALLHHTFNSLQTGAPQSLCQYAGKVLLIVNTASYCGYTPQYEGLEALYRKYRERGLVVLGFPSNDFGAQEPGSNKQVAEFCRTTYGVEFPMFEKTSVARLETQPLYAELAAKTGRVPHWNFHKYVVDRSGMRVLSFDSDVTPDSRDFVSLIEKLLAEKAAPGKS
jgi:glutathione peroxidase